MHYPQPVANSMQESSHYVTTRMQVVYLIFATISYLHCSPQSEPASLQGQVCLWHVDLHEQAILYKPSTSGEAYRDVLDGNLS